MLERHSSGSRRAYTAKHIFRYIYGAKILAQKLLTLTGSGKSASIVCASFSVSGSPNVMRMFIICFLDSSPVFEGSNRENASANPSGESSWCRFAAMYLRYVL
eukprot:GHVT01047815.1.p1 GENE.GHVT01047815.1~~GHVT01047815.1.p1  ORF type:complete len:103 (-),score=4.92 GHVT01047815.1:280-588(-)